MPASRRISNNQLELLVAWMEAHPLQARATQLNNVQGKQLYLRLWAELSSRLNAVGDGVTKTLKEWQQYWSDQKCKAKKKGSAMLQLRSGTGGGQSWYSILTPIEDRILSVMGVQYVMGNENVRIPVDMGFDDSPSPPAVPLLELPLPRPVTPDQTPSTSGHSTLDVAERDASPPHTEPKFLVAQRDASPPHTPPKFLVAQRDASPPHNPPRPRTAAQARPPKRKHVKAVADAESDEPFEKDRLHNVAAPRVGRELEERRLTMDERRMAIDERRMAIDERRMAMDERRMAMDERRMAMDERRMTMDERQMAMHKRQPATDERRPATDERRPATDERRPSTDERRPATDEGQPAMDEVKMEEEDSDGT